jgi:hypothetical protein
LLTTPLWAKKASYVADAKIATAFFTISAALAFNTSRDTITVNHFLGYDNVTGGMVFLEWAFSFLLVHIWELLQSLGNSIAKAVGATVDSIGND